MKMCFFLTLLIIMLTVLSGQSIDSLIIVNKEKIERANNHWDYKSMEESRNNFVRRLGASNKDWLINYYIAYCDYRLVNYYSNSEGNQDTEKAARYLEDGIKRLNESNDANQEFSDGHALLAALYSRKIRLDNKFWSGFIYGKKSSSAIDRSIEIDKNNPRAYLMKGMNAIFTPPKWGGDKEKGLELFTKSIELFEMEERDSVSPDWGYSEVYAWKGVTEKDLGLIDEAKKSYKKALKLNPDYSWVRYVLLPQLKKESSNPSETDN